MVSQSIVDTISQRLKSRLTEEIEDLETQLADVKEGKPGHNISTIVKKLNGRHESILIIDGFVNNLPESLEFFLFSKNPKSPRETGRMRDDFRGAAKWRFLRGVFAEQSGPARFEAMGIEPAKIRDYIDYSLQASDELGRPYDLSIDHIVELAQGGLNAKDNLCILPEYLNIYKGYFTHIQARIGDGQILGIRPKPSDGKPVFVPQIAEGFRYSTKDENIIRERTEALLKTSLRYRYDATWVYV